MFDGRFCVKKNMLGYLRVIDNSISADLSSLSECIFKNAKCAFNLVLASLLNLIKMQP